MTKVYSINTGARLDKQDTEKNDKLAATGDYLGCIPKIEATAMRSLQEMLICEQAQINELIDKFDKEYANYLENVVNVLIMLGIDYSRYNVKTDKLMISEDGNVWITKGEEEQ